MYPERLQHDEMQAAMAARRELGPSYEQELAESLVDRVNAVIDARLADRKETRRPTMDWAQMTLGLGSLTLSIPLVAITASYDNPEGMFAVLAIIAVINLAYALRGMTHRRN